MTPPAPRIVLRRARADDAEQLLAWRNDPQTRRWYVNPDAVSRAEHLAWFAHRLEDGRSRIYIADRARHPVGQLRLDRTRSGAVEVSFSVVPGARGSGMGTAILRGALRLARRDFRTARVVAKVKPENVASAIAFLKADYRFTGVRRTGQVQMYVFEAGVAR